MAVYSYYPESIYWPTPAYMIYGAPAHVITNGGYDHSVYVGIGNHHFLQ